MNAGLLLVQLDGDARQCMSAWDERLRATAGVGAVTWWSNLKPHRDDWIGQWRKLRDFETLAVCEIDGSIDEIVRPEGVRSLLVRRASRPSQGILRLPTLGLCVVLISPKNAADDASAAELRRWGDLVHFPGIVEANIPGYGLVTPYENVELTAPRFLHCYEFFDADAEAVFQMTRACVARRLGTVPGSEAFQAWADHPAMSHDYLGNFTRILPDGAGAHPARTRLFAV